MLFLAVAVEAQSCLTDVSLMMLSIVFEDDNTIMRLLSCNAARHLLCSGRYVAASEAHCVEHQLAGSAALNERQFRLVRLDSRPTLFRCPKEFNPPEFEKSSET